MRNTIAIFSTILVAGSLVGCGDEQAPGQAVSFSKDVKPIIDQNCLVCHTKGGEGYEKSGLSMESYDDLLKGTKFGPVIKPGHDLSSTLVIVIVANEGASIHMPHYKEPLPGAQIETIRAWVEQGALNN